MNKQVPVRLMIMAIAQSLGNSGRTTRLGRAGVTLCVQPGADRLRSGGLRTDGLGIGGPGIGGLEIDGPDIGEKEPLRKRDTHPGNGKEGRSA